MKDYCFISFVAFLAWVFEDPRADATYLLIQNPFLLFP